MRGNPVVHYRLTAIDGSIPAYAGEPIVDLNEILLVRVYPRVCGGTYGFRRRAGLEVGLSPRMRGNPSH